MFWNITRDVELLPWSGSVLAKCLSYCLDWPNWPKKTKKGSLLHVWSLLLRIVFCLADLCVDLGLSQSGRNSISSKFLKIYLNVPVRLIDTVLMSRRVSLTSLALVGHCFGGMSQNVLKGRCLYYHVYSIFSYWVR